jgi:hypothetical protein
MGKGTEAEQSDAQLAGDHGAATVKEKPIKESAEDKLTVNHSGINEERFSQNTVVKEKLIKGSAEDKLTMNHAGFNEKRFSQLITEGNIMAIRKMLITFKEEINSCREKIEVGVESYWAGQKMGLQMKHHVEQPKYVKKPQPIVKKTYFQRKTLKSKPRWRVKNTGPAKSCCPEQLLESRRNRSPELNLGSTGTVPAAQVNCTVNQNCESLQQPVESAEGNAMGPESRLIESQELNLGSTRTDQAAQANCIAKQNCDGLQQPEESVEDNTMVPESGRRLVLESKSTMATMADPILVTEKSDKADQAFGKTREHKADNKWLVAAVGGSPEVEEMPELDRTVSELTEVALNPLRCWWTPMDSEPIVISIEGENSDHGEKLLMGKELIQLRDEEVVDCEPLAVQKGDMLEGDLTKEETFEWVVERVKGFCHVVGLSLEGHEEEMLALFRATEADRKTKASHTENGIVVEPTPTSTKGKRELQRLACSINYDGKKGIASKVNGKGRGSTVI